MSPQLRTQRVENQVGQTLADLHRELVAASLDPHQVATWLRERLPLTSDAELRSLATQLEQRLFGFGPLDHLLADSSVSEIMVNGPGPVWVERRGHLDCTTVVIERDEIDVAIDRIVAPLGLRLDRTVPFVDARLDDGSRVHIAIAPLAVAGPYLTIRRFSDEVLPLDAFGDGHVEALLRQAVADRMNIVVTGATGAGKTSLLAALASSVPTDQRLVVIEDTAELQFGRRHVVRLEARPATAEGVGELTVRTLVRNALRMRPDRLIVGEVRGAEAFDMIQALSTGHAGSLSTCHANSPADAVDRLTSMVLMADTPLTESLAERQVLTAIDLIVHVARHANGARHVTDIVALERNAKPRSLWRAAAGSRESPQ